MAFMMDKFKGKYRLLAPIDSFTNSFPRDLNGNYSDHDIYISCSNGIMVTHYGHGVLECYIPSIGRGRNIIKVIYSDFIKPIEESDYITITKREKDGEIITTNSFNYEELYQDKELNKLIYSIMETDEEVTFRFKWDMMEKFEQYLKPKTSAASRSPFSSKNLPRGDYEIPEEDMNQYKAVASKLPKEDVLKLGHWTNDYIKTLATKKNKLEDIKADMKKKMLKSKEYIHSISKWDNYLDYLEKAINELNK